MKKPSGQPLQWEQKKQNRYDFASFDGSPSGQMSWWLCVICLFSILLPTPLSAQQGKNPFDQEKIASDQQNPNNPFDLIRGGNRSAQGYNPFDVVKSHEGNMDRLELMVPQRKIVKPKNTAQDNFNFILYSSILILFTFLFTMFRGNLVQIYRGFFNENILKLIHREQTGIVKAPYIIWYLFFFVSMSAFIIQIAQHFYPMLVNSLWVNFGLIFLSLTVIYIIKHIGMMVLGFIFPIQKEMGVYSFTFLITSITLGIALIPINLIIAFGPSWTYAIFIYLGLILAGITYAYGYLRILFLTSRKWVQHIFHFFVYLCSVEIAPIIVLFKLIMFDQS